MSVKAKFQCNQLSIYPSNREVKLTAVYSGKGENADFTKATPNGSLSMVIMEDVPASKFFTPGKNYYVTFEEAPE